MSQYGQEYKEFDLIEEPLFSLKPRISSDGFPVPAFDENGEIEDRLIQSKNDLIMTGMKNLIRDDKMESVGVVSNKYRTVPHKVVVRNIYNILDKECEEIDKSRSTILLDKTGSKMWMHLVLNSEKFSLSPHDEIAKQVIVKHATDGSSSLWIWIGAYTFVCSNLTLIGETFSRVAIAHNREVDFTEVQNQLVQGLNGFEKRLNMLAPLKETKIPSGEADLWINTMLKRNKSQRNSDDTDLQFVIPKTHIDKIRNMWFTKDVDATVNRQGNDLLSLMNTFTEYYSRRDDLSPDAKHRYISHSTSRVMDLYNNFDEELEFALTLSQIIPLTDRNPNDNN